MALPLFTRAAEDDGSFVVMSGRSAVHASQRHDAERARATTRALVPDRAPADGEQYRFHINMAACIGCKCCVVACNEQNGNPAPINWRRVSEVEGGTFPTVRRAYVSMGCNHCADPTCLAGCPVDAYSKDEATGIVRHDAGTCIGCQYCTWTCSYGVPQFNPERGVVGKCDMCHGRLALGQAPACVSACPEGAIGIEIVDVAAWRAWTAAEGRPEGDGSLSTSRLTLPVDLPVDARPVESATAERQHAHAPLVLMTVLTQWAAGAFATVALALLAGVRATDAQIAIVVGLLVLGLGLAASTLHLGRPIYAYRALRMWRRSWLSREVVLFGAFAHGAVVLMALSWTGWSGATTVATVTAAVGLAGVVASAFIYHVPSRPLWHWSRTSVQFGATTLLLGALTAVVTGLPTAGSWQAVAVLAGGGQLLFLGRVVRTLRTSDARELGGAWQLLSTSLRPFALWRVALLVVGGIVLPVVASTTTGAVIALLLACGGEFVGRYLFFVAAVPRHMTAPYLAADRIAA